ncbi:MAG: CopG family transcriptional regulator [Thermodesulfobacteriota bacterium]|nr:CopG family transcriptional regulator [Thermodesulfobacteriota bacterium]
MKAKELKFDEGKSVLEHLDLSKARRPNQEQTRVNVDFPLWMIQSLNKAAKRFGVPRQLIIKIWLAEGLNESASV